MTDLLLLALGSFLISTSTAYLWWARVRVVFLRQKLFEIRDKLWLLAYQSGGLEDQRYKEARDHLNGMIRMARMMSVPVIMKMHSMMQGTVPASGDCDKDALPIHSPFHQSIQRSLERAEHEMTKFMLYHRATGLIFLGCSLFKGALQGKSSGPSRAKRKLTEWLRSPKPEDLSRLDKWSESRHLSPLART